MALDHVQQTLFFPLLGRATAARRWPELFPDPWAQEAAEIHGAEGESTRDLGDFPAAVYGLRHRLTLQEVRRYLGEHPGAAVVVIGCGLDRLVDEIDDADSTVYNLDFPEVLEMRSRWVPAHPREVNLPFSVTDHRWMDRVDAERGMIAVAPGVFYYLEVDAVRALVAAMGERFPGGRLCYDAESPFVTAQSEKEIKRNGTPDAHMPFRVKGAREVSRWSDRIAGVRVEYDFSSYLDDRSALPAKVRAAFTGMRLVKGMYEVVVTFAGRPPASR